MITRLLLGTLTLLIFYLVINKVFKIIFKFKKSVGITFIRSLVLVMGTLIIAGLFLSTFDVTKDISNTLLRSSAVLIALVTFSFQKVLGNVIAGIMISIFKPFEVNDKITILSGSNEVSTGLVSEINLRHTTIIGSDGKCSLVPNSVLDECVIVNNDTIGNHGNALELECSYDSDVDLAIELMQQEIDNNSLVINKKLPQSKILCSELGANGFKLKSIIWTENLNDNYTACSQLRLSIYKSWSANNIKLPYNTVTIDKGK